MKKGKYAGTAIKWLLLLALTFTLVYPFLWMLVTSFKPEPEIVKFPPQLFSGVYGTQAYSKIWDAIPFLKYYRNTVIFATMITVVSLMLDTMAGYAFARLNFPGKNILFSLVLGTLMIPFQVVMIPLYAELFHLKLINTYLGLLLPRATNAFGIFMMRQFFISLPGSLEEAARIDGCSEFRIYWSIMLPLCKPAIISLAIFHFMFNWNDLLYPLILTVSDSMRTLPAGLALFMGQHVIEYGLLMAGACLSVLPIFVAYVFAQKYFVKGIAMTGMKG